MDRKECVSGDWVQIERVILEAGSRAPGVPEDTAALPMIARMKGFAVHDAVVGEPLEVESTIGRRLAGTLVAVLPTYSHDFGAPVPELTRAGLQARARVRGEGG